MSCPETVSTAELATFCRVTPGTVRRWMREGKITPVPTPGRNHVWRLADVLAAVGTEPETPVAPLDVSAIMDWEIRKVRGY